MYLFAVVDSKITHWTLPEIQDRKETQFERQKREKREILWQFFKLCVAQMIDQIMNVVNMLRAHNASELQFYRELLRIYQVLIFNLLSKYKNYPLISLSNVLKLILITTGYHY